MRPSVAMRGRAGVALLLVSALACSDPWGPGTVRRKFAEAVLAARFEEATRLLGEGAEVDAVMPDGSTLLHTCALAGVAPEFVSYLLEHGADVDLRVAEGPFEGWTPLMLAAHSGREETVRLLLEAGADVFLRAPDGTTAVSAASTEGHDGVASLIAHWGRAPDAKEPPK